MLVSCWAEEWFPTIKTFPYNINIQTWWEAIYQLRMGPRTINHSVPKGRKTFFMVLYWTTWQISKPLFTHKVCKYVFVVYECFVTKDFGLLIWSDIIYLSLATMKIFFFPFFVFLPSEMLFGDHVGLLMLITLWRREIQSLRCLKLTTTMLWSSFLKYGE